MNDDFPLFVAAISAGDDVSHVDGIFCRLKWRERSDANNTPSHQRRLNNQVAFIKTPLSFFFRFETHQSFRWNEWIHWQNWICKWLIRWVHQTASKSFSEYLHNSFDCCWFSHVQFDQRFAWLWFHFHYKLIVISSFIITVLFVFVLVMCF